MFNWLIGRGKVEVKGCRINSPSTGDPIPAVYVAWRNHWFNWKVVVIDMISFLLISEKLVEHKAGDFVYKKNHSDTDTPSMIELTVPAWAVEGVTMRVAELAPLVYKGLKEADAKALKAAEALRGQVPDEVLRPMTLPENSAVEKYKKLHAKVNGYQYIPPAANDSDGKVLHCVYIDPTLKI